MAALADDLINRNKDVLRFKTLLDNIDDSCSIALDGKWGSGKTFFVKQLKTILEAYNPSFKDAATDNYTRIKSRMEAYKVHGDELQSIMILGQMIMTLTLYCLSFTK